MSEGFFKVTKSFILYRQEHSEDCETLADGETVGVHPIRDFQEGTLLVRGGQGFISVTTRGAGSPVSVYSTDGRCLRHLYIQQERFKNFKGIHSNAQMTEKNDSPICRARCRLCEYVAPGYGNVEAICPRLYPHPQSFAHHCRPRRLRKSAVPPHCRSHKLQKS